MSKLQRSACVRPLCVFISGPYSAPHPHQRIRNTEMATSAALAVMQRGHHPIEPHAMGYCSEWLVPPGGPVPPGYEEWMALCLAWLRRADALLYLGSSPGSDRELAEAKRLGLRIYTGVEQLPRVEYGAESDWSTKADFIHVDEVCNHCDGTGRPTREEEDEA